jgi:hypothetical protein
MPYRRISHEDEENASAISMRVLRNRKSGSGSPPSSLRTTAPGVMAACGAYVWMMLALVAERTTTINRGCELRVEIFIGAAPCQAQRREGVAEHGPLR